MVEANRDFAEGRFDDSAAKLERLIAERGPSAALLFDLGNAYLRAGNPAKATLEYERAALLAPRDRGIDENLAVARTATGADDERGMLRRAVDHITIDAWTGVAAACLWVAALAFGLATLARTRRPSCITGGVAGVVAGAMCLGALAVRARVLDEAVVLAPTPVRVSPFESAQSSLAFPAGSIVALGARDGAYVLARDGHGRRGWVEASRVEAIIPSS
jgi:tetratricopeptide (TPR) repeat protein